MNANRKSHKHAVSIGTTTDDLKWPWMASSSSRAISAVAELLVPADGVVLLNGRRCVDEWQSSVVHLRFRD